MKLPRWTPEGEFYRDAEGYDAAQDSRWDEVDPSMFGADPNLDEWPRPYRSVWRPAVCRDDFDPAGLPKLHPTRPEHPGAVPALTDCQGNNPPSTPANSSGRRAHPPFAA